MKETSAGNGDRRWYCVRAKPKSEHLAAAHLSVREEIEVFCPRIRFEKATRRGKVWFVEALFPGYVFARFDLAADLRLVQATSAVMGVVHFREDYPVIEPQLIDELRQEFADGEPRTVDGAISEGDEVLITGGALRGLNVLVTRLVPGRDRVRVLLEWLGQEREADIALQALAHPGGPRPGLRGSAGLGA